MPRVVVVLGRLGDNWEVPDDVMDELKAFRFALCANPGATTVNEVHYTKLPHLCDTADSTTSKSIDVANLPQCWRYLEQHIKFASCLNVVQSRNETKLLN